jgi:hypothetical protein
LRAQKSSDKLAVDMITNRQRSQPPAPLTTRASYIPGLQTITRPEIVDRAAGKTDSSQSSNAT